MCDIITVIVIDIWLIYCYIYPRLGFYLALAVLALYQSGHSEREIMGRQGGAEAGQGSNLCRAAEPAVISQLN